MLVSTLKAQEALIKNAVADVLNSFCRGGIDPLEGLFLLSSLGARSFLSLQSL